MEQKQLERIKAWFDGYVAKFYGDDAYVNANLKLKEDHSRRTSEKMVHLAERLGLDENQQRTAEALGLLHDTGRFDQFSKYRTYSDVRSVNHALVGLDVLGRERVLEELEPTERALIETAIEYHVLKELPAELDGQELLFCRMIRDADKLDVYYVVAEYSKLYRENPKDFAIELELPDEPTYTGEIAEAILQGRQVPYANLRTLNDLRLLHIAWVYDVNFNETLEQIKAGGFLQELFHSLPDSRQIDRIRSKIFEYIERRLEQGSPGRG